MHLKKISLCYGTCNDVLQGTVLPLAHLRFRLPPLQLGYQVHLGHLRHCRPLVKHPELKVFQNLMHE